jgi:AbrB family looped-hinge helix DNA binding protein
MPREVRKLLGISEGDVVEWVYEDGKIIVRRGV